jgi:hypothetical protein
MRIGRIGFAIAISMLVSTDHLGAQQVAASRKEPHTAQAYAWLCPGCGHLYSGETAKGAAIAAVSVGSLLTGAAIQVNRRPSVECERPGDRFECTERDTDFRPLFAGAAVSVASYLYGLIDAGPSAKRMEQRGFGISPTVQWREEASAEIGLQLQLRR